jgi:hypothetical protein
LHFAYLDSTLARFSSYFKRAKLAGLAGQVSRGLCHPLQVRRGKPGEGSKHAPSSARSAQNVGFQSSGHGKLPQKPNANVLAYLFLQICNVTQSICLISKNAVIIPQICLAKFASLLIFVVTEQQLFIVPN